MRVLTRVAVLALVVALAAGTFSVLSAHAWTGIDSSVPVAMADEGGSTTETGAERDVDRPLFWSIVGIAAGAVVMAGLYLLKRAVGGFPKNPSWVAPISIEPSSTFLDDTRLGDLAAGSHAAHH